eukprot:356047-Chlamydomonas_euryale.AAC.4
MTRALGAGWLLLQLMCSCLQPWLMRQHIGLCKQASRQAGRQAGDQAEAGKQASKEGRALTRRRVASRRSRHHLRIPVAFGLRRRHDDGGDEKTAAGG